MKRLIVILAMVMILTGCASDPRIAALERHQGHLDKQINYTVMDGIDKGSARCLISCDRELEKVEINTDLIIDKVNHPVKWWWKNKFREWGD